jgi:hypothetical protein
MTYQKRSAVRAWWARTLVPVGAGAGLPGCSRGGTVGENFTLRGSVRH